MCPGAARAFLPTLAWGLPGHAAFSLATLQVHSPLLISPSVSLEVLAGGHHESLSPPSESGIATAEGPWAPTDPKVFRAVFSETSYLQRGDQVEGGQQSVERVGTPNRLLCSSPAPGRYHAEARRTE